MEFQFMANQYTSSFAHVVQEKFGKSAKELLTGYAENNVTYDEASKMTGFTTGTIRKWCSRHRIYLHNKPSSKRKKSVEDLSLLATKQVFKTKKINSVNALSRQWSIGNHGRTFC